MCARVRCVCTCEVCVCADCACHLDKRYFQARNFNALLLVGHRGGCVHHLQAPETTTRRTHSHQTIGQHTPSTPMLMHKLAHNCMHIQNAHPRTITHTHTHTLPNAINRHTRIPPPGRRDACCLASEWTWTPPANTRPETAAPTSTARSCERVHPGVSCGHVRV